MTAKDAIIIARKYNLEAEVRQELASGLTPEKALQIFDKLIQGDVIHASAFEHVCRPLQPGEEQLGNLIGFRQYRHDIEQERNYNSLE